MKDTVGCGDSFAAAIAMGYCRTHDVRATLLLANAVGAATAMSRGAGTNVAKADNVMHLLQRAASSNDSSSSSRGGGSLGSVKVAQQDVETAIDVLRSSLATVDDWQEQQQPVVSGNGNGNGNCSNNGSTKGASSRARAAGAA